MLNIITNSLKEAHNALEAFMADESSAGSISAAAGLMCRSLKSGGKIIACGNGGSLCDASHFAEELTARFRGNRIPIPALAVNDSAYITCALNDFSADAVFSRYVEAMGKSGDVLLAISTSGNSENVLNAARSARRLGMKVVALTGSGGGRLAGLSDIEVRAPYSKFSDRVQEIHIKVIHILVECIEDGLKVGGNFNEC